MDASGCIPRGTPARGADTPRSPKFGRHIKLLGANEQKEQDY